METPPDPARDAMLAGMEDLLVVMKNRKPTPEAAGSATETSLGPSGEGDPLAAAPWGAVELDGAEVSSERVRVLERGAIVGRHVVLHKLGAGGMGVVYAAYDPELDRKVALKLLLPGAGGGKARTRLLREAQALGKLAHPNVVGIHDVGTIDEQVWLAMEFVQGRTLGAWLGAPRGWREVLDVMRSAGEGLAAAHAAGLLHRDFKPDNVMVGDDGRVRVMDFGLARTRPARELLEADRPQPERPTVETLAMQITQAGAIVGTPSYMAPEQFRDVELTAAVDQFAFCVTLWEALHGERPFKGRTLMELIANVLGGRRRPPPKGRAIPSRLRSACERGLSVDPQQRWPSMEALLSELRRLVVPRSRRWMVVGLTVGLAAMGGGVALGQYTEVMDRCTGARAQLEGIWDDARRREVKAAILGTELVYAPDTWERVEQRLDEYTDDWTTKHTEVCKATRVTEEQTEEVMDLRMGCLRGRRTAMNAAVKVLVEADDEVVEKAVELVADLPMLTRCDDVDLLAQQRQRVPPPEDPQVAQEVEVLRERLADIEAEKDAGKYAHALQEVERVVQRAEALEYQPLLAEAKLWRGRLFDDDDKYAEAEQDLEEAYALALAHEHDDVTLLSARELTYAVGQQAREAEALVWGQTAMPLAEGRGEDELAASLNNVGTVLERQGEYEQAKLHHQRALHIREKVLGVDHPFVAASLNNLGNAYSHQGEYEQAKLHVQRGLQILEKALGGAHPHLAKTLNNLGSVFERQGDYEQAELHYRRGLQILEKAVRADHPEVAKTLNNLGNVFERQGAYEQAELHHRRALQIQEKALGTGHPDVATSSSNLGSVFFAQGEHEQAKLHFQRALQIRERVLGADHPQLAQSLGNLGNVYYQQGEYEQAKLHYQRALQILEKALGADHPHVAVTLNNLGSLFLDQGEYEQAERHFQRALQIREKALGADHPGLVSSLERLAEVALAQQQPDIARSHAERAVAIGEARTVAPELLARARFVLARALWTDKTQRPRARELAEQARDTFREVGKAGEDQLAKAEAWLAEHRVR